MDYDSIPANIQKRIPITKEDFNNSPDAVKNYIYEAALEEHESWSQYDTPEQDLIDFTGWSGRGHYYRRPFNGYTYRDYIFTKEGHDITITEENVHTFFEAVEQWGPMYNPGDGWTAYEVTLVTSKGYINSSPGSILGAIYKRTEQYDDDYLVVQTIVIRYTTQEGRQRISNKLYAGAGEGIPIKLENGFWLLDLVRSKTLCIVNCYVLWIWYTAGNLDVFFNGGIKKLLKERDKISKNIHDSGTGISISDLHSKYPHDYDIMFCFKDVYKLNPDDTIRKCIYYYYNGHMYLLAHEKNLSSVLPCIIKKSKQTTVCKIRNKQVPIFSENLHVMDIESYRKPLSDEHQHIPIIVGHMYLGIYKYFTGDDCIVSYLKWLNTQIDDTLVVWAHNGGKYDFHIILKDALTVCNKKLDNPIELLDINGKYIQMLVKFPDGKKIYFRDSCALIPGSLNKIAKDFKVSGKLQDIDIINVSKEQLLYDTKYLKYNKQDCKALTDILRIYQEEGIKAFGVDPLNHPSASSYGKRLFYSKYYQESTYPLYTLPRNVHKYIYQAYGGGRCEVFYRGKLEKPMYYYDINSSYPNAGCRLLPYDKPVWHENLRQIRGIYNFLKLHPGFYKVHIKHCGPVKPIHGVMTKGKYIFPKFNSKSEPIVLFSEEIKYGITQGWEYVLIEGYEFKLATWGNNFFTSMYNNKVKAKHAGNKALEYIFKITANSSYGFFGYDKYDRSVTKIYGPHMLEHVTTLEYSGKATYHQYEDTIVSHENVDVLLDDVNVAVAAAITAYGRIHLHKLMVSIEKHGGKILYVDTDSIITDLKIENVPELKDLLGDKLGQLKSELAKDDYITEGIFVSCKLYGFKTKNDEVEAHAKGVRKDKEKLYNDLVEMLSQPKKFNVGTMITSRIRKTKGDMYVYDKVVEKTVSGKYTKRHVLADGNTNEMYY